MTPVTQSLGFSDKVTRSQQYFSFFFFTDELETEDRKRKEILRQEKESLIKKRDEKRQLAELQLEIEQLKKNTTELENGKKKYLR